MSSNEEEKGESFAVVGYTTCCLGFPFWFPVYLVGAVLFILYGGVVQTIWFFQERNFQKQMQEQSRFIDWNDLTVKLDEGQGTIIVEGQNKMPDRVWWTPDNVPALYVEELPTAEKLLEASYAYYCSDETHPFVEWCFSRYLNSEAGIAYLTKAPHSIMKVGAERMKGASGFNCNKLFKDQFPKIQGVDTVRKL